MRGCTTRAVFVAGGIASGKSTVARHLEELGASRIDLDQLSREVLAPGHPCLAEVCDAFGDDLVDADGVLDRGLLARRAFADPESAVLLESIELPWIKGLLADRLTFVSCAHAMPEWAVVEVPLLDRVEDLLPLADEVLVVCAPWGERCRRAQERGLSAEDFEARAANQPADEYLRSRATFVLENDGTPEHLLEAVDRWLQERSEHGRG